MGIAAPVAATLTQAGLAVPAPVPVEALIDTGAQRTFIDDLVAQNMGITPVGSGTLSSASHAAVPSSIYAVAIEFAGTGIRLDFLQVMGANLGAHGLGMLIGRDLLRYGMLVYNGQTGIFSFSL